MVTFLEPVEPPLPPLPLSELPHADTPSAQRTAQPEAAIKEFLKNPLLNGYSGVVRGIVRTRRADGRSSAEDWPFAGDSAPNSLVRRALRPSLAWSGMPARRRERDPLRLSRFEVLGAWLHVWT